MIEVLLVEDLSSQEYRCYLEARNYFNCQTSTWHINSLKRVSAAVFVKSCEKVFVGQNIGISKVTGTLCAERAAITNAVCNYPKAVPEDFEILCVIGEESPLLPCGVCCEWLYKINPKMILLAMSPEKGKIIRLPLISYFSEEKMLSKL